MLLSKSVIILWMVMLHQVAVNPHPHEYLSGNATSFEDAANFSSLDAADSYSEDAADSYRVDPADSYSLDAPDSYSEDAPDSYPLDASDSYRVDPADSYSEDAPDSYPVDASDSYRVDPEDSYSEDAADSYSPDASDSYSLDAGSYSENAADSYSEYAPNTCDYLESGFDIIMHTFQVMDNALQELRATGQEMAVLNQCGSGGPASTNTPVTTKTTTVGYGQMEMPDCPASILEFGAWLPKVLSICQKQMIKALRESKDNCEEKVGTVGPCLTTEKDRCTEALANDDMLKNIIDQTLSPIIVSTEFYSYIYCSTGPIIDIAVTTTVQGCPREMEAASLACHAPYVAIFNEDRVDVRLCDAYNTMITCETDKVRELCTDADVETVSIDDMTRRMGNYYCIDDDETPVSPSED